MFLVNSNGEVQLRDISGPMGPKKSMDDQLLSDMFQRTRIKRLIEETNTLIAKCNIQFGESVIGSMEAAALDNRMEKLYKIRALYLVSFDIYNAKVIASLES